MMKWVGFFQALASPRSAWKFYRRRAGQQTYLRSTPTVVTVAPVLGAGLLETFGSSDESAVAKISAGHLRLYDAEDVEVGLSIDWTRDYLHRGSFPADKPYNQISVYELPGSDIKTPWEISRFLQLPTVAATHQKANVDNYSAYFVSVITDWIEKNPVNKGVNWVCAMEVAIRVCNWLVSYEAFSEGEQTKLGSKFYERFYQSLWEHAHYIESNLEDIGVKNNHYLADITGLLWLSILAPELPNTKERHRFALSEFEKEVMHQFRPDGLNFEGSLSYHRLSLEMALYTAWLCNRHKIVLAKPVLERLKMASRATINYLQENGEAPQIGDNDSGRFLIFQDYLTGQSLNQEYLLKVISTVFSQGDLSKKNTLTVFEDSGLAVVRQGSWQLTFSNLHRGQDGRAGHNHDDVGSFTLAYGAHSLIIDPGTGWYTPEPTTRNWFRSTSAHNAPVATAREIKGDLFDAPEFFARGDMVATAESLICNINRDGERVRRTISSKPKQIIVTDELLNFDPKTAKTSFTLHPTSNPSIAGGTVNLLGGKISLSTTGANIALEQTKWSPAYSKIEPAKAIVIHPTEPRYEVKFTFND